MKEKFEDTKEVIRNHETFVALNTATYNEYFIKKSAKCNVTLMLHNCQLKLKTYIRKQDQ